MAKSQLYINAVQVGKAEKVYVGEGASNSQEMDGKYGSKPKKKGGVIKKRRGGIANATSR